MPHERPPIVTKRDGAYWTATYGDEWDLGDLIGASHISEADAIEELKFWTELRDDRTA